MFTPVHDMEGLLGKLRERYGRDMSVAVLPLGPLTIPYVQGE